METFLLRRYMMKLKEGLAKYEHLPREEYFKVNQRLADQLWDREVIPTVGDIASFMNGESNQIMKNVFDFFDNEEDFAEMAKHQGEVYDEEESASFIKNVMSSNNTDIATAGFFYKLLMASADDFTIVEKNCKSDGMIWKVSELDEETYNYRIRCSWVNELKCIMRCNFEKFLEKVKGLEEISVRTPLTCNCFPHDEEENAKMVHKGRGICKRCAGALPSGTFNIGAFTTLMVTEHATQSALNSMNKGRKENINDMLDSKFKGSYDWGSISHWINGLVEDLKGENVSARFYEIALMSRVRFDKEGPFVSSLKSSINRSGNLFGAYIFTPTDHTFRSMLEAGQFEDSSLKLQIAMNQYRSGGV